MQYVLEPCDHARKNEAPEYIAWQSMRRPMQVVRVAIVSFDPIIENAAIHERFYLLGRHL
jgi:hypothetical protein